jgi:hypothetical protein
MRGERTSQTMLFKRWKRAFHDRYAGAGHKPPMGAVFKRYGTEHMRKRQ